MPKNSVRSILITGAKGFIGKKLVALLSHDYHVIGIDIGDHGVIDSSDCDINDLEKLESIFVLNKIDFVIHCAAEIGRLHGEEEPAQMLGTNVLGTLNIIKCCLKFKAKLINFATSEVCYPLTNVYGISKDCAEKLVKHYVETYGLRAVSIRPFMIYGPGLIASKYKSALDQFVWNTLNKRRSVVHRRAVRSWLHVDDFVEAIKLIVLKHKFLNNTFETYNIGTEDYQDMESIMKHDIGGRYNVEEPPKILTRVKRSDFTKIKDLGWKPKKLLTDGIRELFDWYRSMV